MQNFARLHDDCFNSIHVVVNKTSRQVGFLDVDDLFNNMYFLLYSIR